jgi:hypothetical protein
LSQLTCLCTLLNSLTRPHYCPASSPRVCFEPNRSADYTPGDQTSCREPHCARATPKKFLRCQTAASIPPYRFSFLRNSPRAALMRQVRRDGPRPRPLVGNSSRGMSRCHERLGRESVMRLAEKGPRSGCGLLFFCRSQSSPHMSQNGSPRSGLLTR